MVCVNNGSVFPWDKNKIKSKTQEMIRQKAGKYAIQIQITRLKKWRR